MIEAKRISKSFGSKILFGPSSFAVPQSRKVALVGRNGTGKSTLLKILAKKEASDEGSVVISANKTTSFLPQAFTGDKKVTVREFIRTSVGIETIESEMRKLESNSDLNSPSNLERYGELQSQFEALEGYTFNQRFHVILQGFGLPPDIYAERMIDTLSGGQKSKVMLAITLLSNADILLLDEPTNNLDIASLVWLEAWLKQSQATCIIISHDQRFLEVLAEEVLEIDDIKKEVVSFSGSYSSYVHQKETSFRKQMEKHQRDREKVERLRQTADGIKQRSGSQSKKPRSSDNDKNVRANRKEKASQAARSAAQIERRIEKMDLTEKPLERKEATFLFPSSVDTGKQPRIELENVVAGHESGFNLGPLSLSVTFGKRIALLGENGSGKTTLLRTLAGSLEPLSGKIAFSDSAVIGNFMQEHENLTNSKTSLEVMTESVDIQTAYHYLARYGFSETEARKSVSSLSPGQKARLIFADLSARSANILLFDEPTNHLDMEAVDSLKEVLSTYDGTVVVVSHDRDFLEAIDVSDYYLITGGCLERKIDFKEYVESMYARAQKILRTL